MGLRDSLARVVWGEPEPPEGEGTRVFATEEDEAAIVLQEEVPRLLRGEVGASGQTRYSQVLPEYNTTLRGKNAIRTYDEMRRGDAQIRGTLRLVKMPIISAQWYTQPCHDELACRERSEFVEWNLINMDHTFIRFLWEALLLLDYGHYVFEKVFDVGTWKNPMQERPRAREVTKWSKFAPRHPMTIQEWRYDSSGNRTGIQHERVDGVTGMMDIKDIDVRRLIIFTLDEEAENPEGMSILRSAYKHWYYKDVMYKVDAIQKERHGIGIPVVKLPPGFTNDDKTLAREMARNLRTNEEAYVVLPPGWEIEFLALNTQAVNVLDSAEHHDLMIARNTLTQFINLGSTTTGSRALGGQQMELFVKALRYITDIVRSEFNAYHIPELIGFNWAKDGHYPELRVRRIGETTDWRAMSVAIRNLMEPGALTPDAETEKWLRDQMDLPIMTNEASDRTIDDRLNKNRPVVGPGAGFGRSLRPNRADQTPPNNEGSNTGGPVE